MVTLALFGCAVGCGGGDIHRPYTYTFIQSGGFGAVHNELVVDSDAKLVTLQYGNGQRKTADATEEDLKALEDGLKKASFMSLHGPYECMNCADQFVYDATVTMERSQSHTVHWEDGSNAPAGLTALGAWSMKLIQSKFPPPPIPALVRVQEAAPLAPAPQ